MDGYSYLLFMPVAKEYSDRNMPMPEIICAEDFPDKAGAEDWCFMERCRMEPYIDRIESLVIYRWNRTYPSDFKLDIATDRWKTVHCREFRGFSHDRITEEIYENA